MTIVDSSTSLNQDRDNDPDLDQDRDLSVPGEGWTKDSNRDPQIPTMHPIITTRPQHGHDNGNDNDNGHGHVQRRLQLYSSQRRLLHSNSSWSRTSHSDPNDPIAKSKPSSNNNHDNSNFNPRKEAKTIKALMSQLSESFYKKGWQVGTAGGISMRMGNGSTSNPYRVFTTPSGIQKEDMIGDDVFELDMDQNIIEHHHGDDSIDGNESANICGPKERGLKLSSMTSLWYIIYQLRPNTMCILHTHSMYAQLATLLDPTESLSTLTITHNEMIKGVGNHAYNDTLTIPIIQNQPSEDQLGPDLSVAIANYPKCNAVLVRRHGVYVWGDSWEQAKTQLECFDYLFELAVRMKSLGLDCGIVPHYAATKENQQKDGNTASNTENRSSTESNDKIIEKHEEKNNMTKRNRNWNSGSNMQKRKKDEIS